jgi:hypothetical protein
MITIFIQVKKDPISEWLAKSLRTLQKGAVQLNIEGKPAAKIRIIDNGNKILVDLMQPTFFRTECILSILC